MSFHRPAVPTGGLAVLVWLTACAVSSCAGTTGFHPALARPQIEQPGPETAAATSPTIAPIEPDRPDVTNGTSIVEEGLLQLEAGGQRARMGTARSVGTPLTARVGLFEWLEGRVSTDGFLHEADSASASSVSGAGNVQVGAKVRLFADPGGVPVLSVLPTVNLPVASASKGLGSGETDVTLVLLTGTDLGRTSHIDFNYGIGAIGAGEGQPHFAQHLVSASFSHSLTEQLSPYVEGFWISKQDPAGGRFVGIDAGFIQAFTARLAVDGGMSVGLTSADSGFSVFGGLSIIVGDVLGDHGVTARQHRAARLANRVAH